MSSPPQSDSPGSFVVIGAYGGIGSEVCRILAAGGHRVTAAGRNPEKLARLAEECGCDTFQVDATQPDEVGACFQDAVGRYGSLSGVATCAGSLLLKPAHLTSPSEWHDVIATNLTTAFNTIRAAVPVMGKGGSIVLCSSSAAQVGLANHEAIAAAKAGIVGLARSAAATYAARGLRVNCVAPGMTRTPLTAKLLSSEAMAKGSAAMHPLGRIGEAREVARAIAWLLDPEQSWITGQVIGVDGGLARLRTRATA